MEENVNPTPQQPAPAPKQDLRKTFNIVLIVLIGLSLLGALISFFGSFGAMVISFWYGLFSLAYSGIVMAIGIIILVRMKKQQPYGFLAVGFFAIAFICGIISMILGYGTSTWTFIVNLLALACAVLAVVPTDKLKDKASYKTYILDTAQKPDKTLLAIYALCYILTIVFTYAIYHKAASALKGFSKALEGL